MGRILILEDAHAAVGASDSKANRGSMLGQREVRAPRGRRRSPRECTRVSFGAPGVLQKRKVTRR